MHPGFLHLCKSTMSGNSKQITEEDVLAPLAKLYPQKLQDALFVSTNVPFEVCSILTSSKHFMIHDAWLMSHKDNECIITGVLKQDQHDAVFGYFDRIFTSPLFTRQINVEYICTPTTK